MRVLYLTQYFPPEIGAPQNRIPELMRGLIRRGHRVTILTAMPNYPKGRVFPGYHGRLIATERFEAMDVVRTWIYPTLSVGFLRRTLSQMSFPLSSAFLAARLVGAQDIILAGSPPLFIAWPAQRLAKRLGCPYLAVVADLWPQIAIETGILRSRFGIKLAQAMEKSLYTNARAVLTQTSGQARNIRERFPEVTVHVVSGGVDSSRFAPSYRSDATRREFGVHGKLAVVYAGLHGFAQGLEVILEAAERLRSRPDIALVLIGEGAAKRDLVRQAAARGLCNISFHDSVSRERMPEILASMDLAIVSLRPGVPLETMPTKIYEAMASGLPVVVVADGECHDLANGEDVGIAVPAGSGAGLATAIERLARSPEERVRMGDKALRLVRERFDRELIAERLHELLRTLALSQTATEDSAR